MNICPANKSITIGRQTYRGGDVLPTGAPSLSSEKKPKKSTESKKAKEEVNDGC